MAVDRPEVQRGITKWTLLGSLLIGGITFLLGYKLFVWGLFFGVGLMVLNYRVLGALLDKALAAAVPDMARVLSFVGYHARFWIIVVVMYLVIPKAGFQFGVGSFAGILLPKVIMGIVIVANGNDEWWHNTKPAEKAPVDGNKRDDGIRFPGLDFDERYKKSDADKTEI